MVLGVGGAPLLTYRRVMPPPPTRRRETAPAPARPIRGGLGSSDAPASQITARETVQVSVISLENPHLASVSTTS